MLKRLLITWLTISILSLGISFADATHIDDMTHHGSQTNVGLADFDINTDEQQDHNCHVLIHLLGLNSNYESNIPKSLHKVNAFYTASTLFIPPAPIYHPPIIS